MSFQVIPSDGPMLDARLSELRVSALMAVDVSAPIPTAVVDYLIRLERAYLQLKAEANQGFLTSSWEARGVPST